MTQQKIINTHIRTGVWEGELSGVSTVTPDIKVTHQGAMLEDVTCSLDTVRAMWRIKAPIPARLINDGLQTFTVSDGDNVIAHFTLLAGAALEDDLRAEIDLLRSELNILKSAFRKHCASWPTSLLHLVICRQELNVDNYFILWELT